MAERWKGIGYEQSREHSQDEEAGEAGTEAVQRELDEEQKRVQDEA